MATFPLETRKVPKRPNDDTRKVWTLTMASTNHSRTGWKRTRVDHNRVRTKACYVGGDDDDDDVGDRVKMDRRKAWKDRQPDTWKTFEMGLVEAVEEVEWPPVPVSVEKPSNPSS